MNIKYNINIVYKMLLYDLLYFTADLLIKLRNPCKIHHEKVPSQPDKITCVGHEPCCTSCRYLSDNGCTIKCLGCKLWLCPTASERHLRLQYLLTHMKMVAYRQGHALACIRVPRQELLIFKRMRRITL